MRTILTLLLIAVTALAGDKDITPFLTSAVWKYDHPAKLDVSLRFYRGGKATSETGWDAVWRHTGERTVELTMKDKRTATITFAEDFKAFQGKFFDGAEITGRRRGDVASSLR